MAAECAPLRIPGMSLAIDTADNPKEVAGALQILALLTVLTLVPSILLMMTSFTRIAIVLSFVRSSMGTQQVPPNQVLIGLALFITLFVMMPVFDQMNREALQPYMAGKLKQEEALAKAAGPIRTFMLKQTREKDLALFVDLAGLKQPNKPDDLPLHVVIPAFMISELKTAFQMGFVIFIPFLVVDMLVSSILMSMGMMMLPPVLISLPFKVLLFVLVDGWALVVKSLVESFVR
ncbi:MAG: flagellar type III secretion system pore protein FliP [Clostridia bacterium]|nr:flagellar type III secretion system pore protein FliP [Clostridia bacterium]